MVYIEKDRIHHMKKFTFRRILTSVVALLLIFAFLAVELQPVVVYAANPSGTQNNQNNNQNNQNNNQNNQTNNPPQQTQQPAANNKAKKPAKKDPDPPTPEEKKQAIEG